MSTCINENGEMHDEVDGAHWHSFSILKRAFNSS